MVESEILIAIKTALQADGLDMATAKLKDLIASTKEHAAASGASTIEQAKLDRSLMTLQQNLLRIPAALRGSPEAISGLTRGLGSLAGSLGPVAAIASSLFAGWKVGKLIDDTYGLSNAIAKVGPAVRNIEGPARAAREALEDLDKVKFSNLDNALSAAETRINSLLQRIESLNTRDNEAAAALDRLAAVQAEGGAPGTGTDRAIAEQAFASARGKADLDRKYTEDQLRAKSSVLDEAKRDLAERERLLEGAKQGVSDSKSLLENVKQTGNGESIAIANADLRKSEQHLIAVEAANKDKVPDIQAKIQTLELALGKLGSHLRDINVDMETAAAQRANAMEKARRTDEAIAAAQQASADREDQQAAAQKDREETAQRNKDAAAARSDLKEILPALQAQAAQDQGAASKAQAALAEFDRTGKVGGKRVAGGSINSLERKKLIQNVTRETQEANDSGTRLSAAQNVLDGGDFPGNGSSSGAISQQGEYAAAQSERDSFAETGKIGNKKWSTRSFAYKEHLSDLDKNVSREHDEAKAAFAAASSTSDSIVSLLQKITSKMENLDQHVQNHAGQIKHLPL